MITISTVTQLQELIQSDDHIALDVRSHEEYQQGHIPGSIHFSNLQSSFDPNKTYIVHCFSGGRAIAASQQLHQQGVKVVYSRPGVAAWSSQGLPLEK